MTRRTVFTADIRSPDHDTLTEMEARIREGGERIAADLGLECEIEQAGQTHNNVQS